jgi:D-arginine dehydrogenase
MTRTRVLVVGGGIAGASLAYELASDHDVVLLEAEDALAVHTTGRSAALFLLDYGPPPVRALTAASAEWFEAFSREPGVPQLLTPRGVLQTAWDDADLAALEAAVASTGGALEPVPVSRALELCGFLRADLLRGAAHDPRGCDIDVMALHAHYVRGLRARGGAVHRGARVCAAEQHATGWRVTCTDGRTVEADRVANAAGAWADVVWAAFGRPGHGLRPLRRTIAVVRTAVPVPASSPVVGDVSETWYCKPEPTGVLVSPAEETPSDPCDARADELDVALALERVGARTVLAPRSVVSSWAGLRTFAPDRLPVVGPHPDDASLFSFAGQGGYGIQTAPALARVGAALFRGEAGDPELARALDPARPALQERTSSCPTPRPSAPAVASVTSST